MADDVSLTVNGRAVSLPVGSTVSAAVMIAGHASFRTSVTGQPRGPLCGIGALVDDDLALAVAIGDFTRPFVYRRPFQPHERCIVEMALDNIAHEGRLTIAVCTGKVELAAAIHGAITVIVGFALEDPSIGHFRHPLWRRYAPFQSNS